MINVVRNSSNQDQMHHDSQELMPAISENSNPQTGNDLPDMIPIRMLNEFTYCPRLGYLEWVEGEWAGNLETMEGTFGHRRVDLEPKRAKRKAESGNTMLPVSPTRDTHPTNDQPQSEVGPGGNSDNRKLKTENQSIHARSLMLSAPTEGLLAKLDLLELEGMEATPVDYKRGKAPNIPEGAYEPERVQLCAQGLILQANGFQCDRGVLYFIASKKRVTIEFTDELIQRTRQLRDDFRLTAAAGILPPPLVDSPKCPRCSLVGICLPDETKLLQCGSTLRGEISAEIENSRVGDTGNNDEARIRKLLPANDDALPLYVQTQGAMVGKSGDRLTIKYKDEVLAERRLMDISQVSMFGNVMISAQALRELTTRGIPVCHMTYGGWFHGLTSGLVHKNVELRIRQFEIAADPERSLKIARWFISGKIRNSRTLLRRHLPDDSNDPVPASGVASALRYDSEADRQSSNVSTSNDPSKDTFPFTQQLTREELLSKLIDYRQKAERATSAETLLGLEGMAAKTYFAGLFAILNGRHDFDVNDRNRRPPKDPVNAVLSFVYSLLVKELTVVLQGVGFDPMLGFFHRPRYGRPSLALDVAEEYRPLIGDSVTLMAFNNGEVDHSSFLERAGAVTLTEAGRKSVIAAFERRLEQEVTHPTFGYRVSYRRILEVQARLLARAVTGELPEYVPFCTR
ncbi:MAG: CRISPR-associated endonuclease Cas1 [Planctomycetaceae bacterium]